MTEIELHRARPLLDLIARHESESAARGQGVASGYDVVVWRAFQVCPPPMALTALTVAEVLAWQLEAIAAYRQAHRARIGYSAAGRYQIIRSTLLSLVRVEIGAPDDLFDAETQDRLGFALLERRGYRLWLGGHTRTAAFADSLSKEWASLPFSTGRSYYADDEHGNAALVSRADVLAVLRAIQEAG